MIGALMNRVTMNSELHNVLSCHSIMYLLFWCNLMFLFSILGKARFFEDRERCVFGSKKGNKSGTLIPASNFIFDVTVHVIASNPISSGYICEVQAEGSDTER